MSRDLKIIAHIYNDFHEKFGIPRQSGLADIPSLIVFEPEYRNADALRGIEGFSHLWLLWQFSESNTEGWSPTVRPPRLGGNERMGVFATRSPYRPNSIGLSSVKLESVEYDTPQGAVLHISGADILNGTPILDIKPYLAYTDSHPEAAGGFALQEKEGRLQVDIPEQLLQRIAPEKRELLITLLAQDPRPGYQHDAARIYGMNFGDMDISFAVDGETLTVCDVRKL